MLLSYSKKLPLIHKIKNFIERENKIYILPTSFGLYFLLLILILFAISLTYGHSSAFTTTFLFISLIMMSAIITNSNLKKISIESAKRNGYGWEKSPRMSLVIESKTDKPRQDLKIYWQTQQHQDRDFFIKAQGKTVVELELPELHRGLYQIKHLVLTTTYPLGLFYAWKKIGVHSHFFIPPKPVDFLKNQYYESPLQKELPQNLTIKKQFGDDEFYEHKKYDHADSWRLIDWKVYAKSNELFKKRYYDQWDHGGLVFSYHDLSWLQKEERLSQLCYWITKHIALGDSFKVIMPAAEFFYSPENSNEKELYQALASFEATVAIL